MTTLHRDRKWKIQVFGREHGVPHFHVWTPEGAAVIAIDGSCVLSGWVDAGIMAEAKEWATNHRAAIASEWNRLNPEKQR
jgi:hypothetical protein